MSDRPLQDLGSELGILVEEQGHRFANELARLRRTLVEQPPNPDEVPVDLACLAILILIANELAAGHLEPNEQGEMLGGLVPSVLYTFCFRELSARGSTVPVETLYEALTPRFTEILDFHVDQFGAQPDFPSLLKTASAYVASWLVPEAEEHLDAKVTIAKHTIHLLIDAAKEITSMLEAA